MSDKQLNERSLQLLKSLVGLYIKDGQPVGSKTLREQTELSLSPASIRNIMADLEDLGYLASPHTSAGRVPTTQGLRLFVDSLLQVRPMENINPTEYEHIFNPDQDHGRLVASASQLISNLTQLTGVVTIPRRDAAKLRHVEFLPLSGSRVLVVLVVNEREVQNRIIYTEQHYERDALQQVANYLNQQYLGMELADVRLALVNALHADKSALDSMMQAVLDVADKALSEQESSDDYVLSGQDRLLNIAEGADIERLRELFEAFNQKRDILHIMDRCLDADGIQIFIGQEAGYDVLEPCSVVTARYEDGDKPLGVLGVIGPTRMDYDKAIAAVDVTARLLGAALGSAK